MYCIVGNRRRARGATLAARRVVRAGAARAAVRGHRDGAPVWTVVWGPQSGRVLFFNHAGQVLGKLYTAGPWEHDLMLIPLIPKFENVIQNFQNFENPDNVQKNFFDQNNRPIFFDQKMFDQFFRPKKSIK